MLHYSYFMWFYVHVSSEPSKTMASASKKLHFLGLYFLDAKNVISILRHVCPLQTFGLMCGLEFKALFGKFCILHRDFFRVISTPLAGPDSVEVN
uniref:Secreted protein n=1 Tax=Strongyloides papillosus TaxID=174720 RepID=A0A0N5C2L7_STREA